MIKFDRNTIYGQVLCLLWLIIGKTSLDVWAKTSDLLS